MIEDNVIDKIKASEYADFLRWLIDTNQEHIIDEFRKVHPDKYETVDFSKMKLVEMNEVIKIGKIVPNDVVSYFDGGSISTSLGSTYFTQLFDNELKKYQTEKYIFSDICRNENEYKAFYGALEKSLREDGYILLRIKT